MILSTLEDGRILRREGLAPDFTARADVLVFGAGSAGVYAADAAAREGADVLLCEIETNIGGMHVIGNVTGYYYGAPGGAHDEDTARFYEDDRFFVKGSQWELRQIALTSRLKESGVRLLCRTSPVGLWLDGDRVVGARVFDGNRLLDIRAAMTVDATSDGHLIRMLDVKKEYGRPSDGRFVPFTVRTQHVCHGRFVSVNADSGTMNHYDGDGFTAGVLRAHANALEGVGEGELMHLALHTGVREGLTFEGEARVRYGDIITLKEPERVLFYAYSDLDRHGCVRATEEELFQSFWVVANLATTVFHIPVPMGAVVPRGWRGLVTAGRCLSCDSYAQSAIRMNRDMFRMGECVGVAAAMAVRAGCAFTEIDYDAYLARVRARGCFEGAGVEGRRAGFDEPCYRAIDRLRALGREVDPALAARPKNERIYTPLVLDLDKTYGLLSTDAPGPALWSAYLSPDRAAAAERLYGTMQSAEDTVLQYNCAIGLGLLSDARALPILREMVRGRDAFFFTDNRRSNQFRSAVAVCLLGRLGEEEDLALLDELLAPEERARPMYSAHKMSYLFTPMPGHGFIYFSILSHAIMAAYKIRTRRGLPLTPLRTRLEALLRDPETLTAITEAPKGSAERDEVESFFQYVLGLTKE